MSVEELTIVFSIGRFSAKLALFAIEEVFLEHSIPLIGFSLYNRPLSLSTIRLELYNEQRQTFHIDAQGFEFHLTSVRNNRIQLFAVKSSCDKVLWDDWAQKFVRHLGFVMAWVADYEYEYWQNVEDPTQFATAEKPVNGLRIRSNELPYPLERSVIDTSSNPGRRVFREGYIEAVGAVMWLGDPFWDLTGASRNSVEQSPSLRIDHSSQSVIRLQAATRSFKTAEGETGELQVRFRDLLYPPKVASPVAPRDA